MKLRLYVAIAILSYISLTECKEENYSTASKIVSKALLQLRKYLNQYKVLRADKKKRSERKDNSRSPPNSPAPSVVEAVKPSPVSIPSNPPSLVIFETPYLPKTNKPTKSYANANTRYTVELQGMTSLSDDDLEILRQVIQEEVQEKTKYIQNFYGVDVKVDVIILKVDDSTRNRRLDENHVTVQVIVTMLPKDNPGQTQGELSEAEPQLFDHALGVTVNSGELEQQLQKASPNFASLEKTVTMPNPPRETVSPSPSSLDTTSIPSTSPSVLPSLQPSALPSLQPSLSPTALPSSYPTSLPSLQPSSQPSSKPSSEPSSMPSSQPSSMPSSQPTSKPSRVPSTRPSSGPSSSPSLQPSSNPSSSPSSIPSKEPSLQPSGRPTYEGQERPSTSPSTSDHPSSKPSLSNPPSNNPSSVPSSQPSQAPSPTPATETLQEAIIRDIMPKSSSSCSGSGTTTVTMDYTSSHSESVWADDFFAWENLVFKAEMKHIDANPDRTWRIRIGTGGNMYSLYGPFGESVPGQCHAYAPWIDEVWQSVSVDGSKMTFPNKPYYFIHQAGTYQKDPPFTDIPFFSPSLGSYCSADDRECGFVGWGQQAHVPVVFKNTSVLYFDKYKDCGDGVLEHTALIHNAVGALDNQSYINIPWGGVRTSSLRDHVRTFNDGRTEIQEPIWMWDEHPSYDQYADASGGYTMWAQDLHTKPSLDLSSFQMPCNPSDATQCLNLTIKADGRGCQYMSSQSSKLCRYLVRCQIDHIFGLAPPTDNEYNTLLFTNPDTSASHIVYGVHHWSWETASSGTFIYFFPKETSNTVADFNSKFPKGSRITVTYGDDGKADADNLALALAYGQNSGLREAIGISARDFSVYTLAAMGRNIHPTNRQLTAGDTISTRQYFIVDRYTQMTTRGPQWAQQANKLSWSVGDHPTGRIITIYSLSSSTVGATVDGRGCKASNPTSVCVGNTTPKAGYKPLYHVTCAGQHYIGHDLYHFAPAAIGGGVSPYGNVYRSYVCDGQPHTVRPTWTLLGFFTDSACSSVGTSFAYDEQAC